MPSWVTDAGIFALASAFGCVFLLLRCRKAGYPFGPGARWWAIAIVLITALISTVLGAVAVAAGGHFRAAIVAIVVPSGLWLGRRSGERRGDRSGVFGSVLSWLTLPLRRLNDRMGEDMQDWCDARSLAVARSPQLISDAANHYYLQVVNQLKDLQAREDLDHWRNSIAHKVGMARRASVDTPEVLRTALARHHTTRDARKYPVDDLDRLARRLRSEAENELHLMLAYLYRLRYRKLLTYGGLRPMPPHRSSPRSSQSVVPRT
jgi:hypothetical protein